MSYVNSNPTSFDITTENFIFTIFSERVKSNYPTLPKKELKILLSKNDMIFEGKWHFPLSDFKLFSHNHLDFLNLNEKVFNQHLGFIENHFLSEESSISSIHISLVNEEQVNHFSLDENTELQFFSLKEIESLDIPSHQKKLFSEESSINPVSFLQREILTSTLARSFLSDEFTIAELLLIIQAITPDFSVPKPNFVTRLTDCKARAGLLKEILNEDGSLKKTNRFSQKPAQLYTFNPDFTPKKLSIYNNFN